MGALATNSKGALETVVNEGLLANFSIRGPYKVNWGEIGGGVLLEKNVGHIKRYFWEFLIKMYPSVYWMLDFSPPLPKNSLNTTHLNFKL